MHHATVLKQQYVQDNSQDHSPKHDEPIEMIRRRIALIAEESCHLPGNINGPDLDEFAEEYDPDQPSDFA